MDRVGEREGEVFGGAVEDLLRERAVLAQGGAEGAGFAACLARGKARQGAAGIERGEFADFFVHGPAGATVFEDRALFIEAHVPEFGLAGRRAVVNLSVHDEAAANAAAGIGIEYGIESGAGAAMGLAVSGGV